MLQTSRITALCLCQVLVLTVFGCGDSGDASASSATAPSTAQPAPAAVPPGTARGLRGSVDIDPLLGSEPGQHACLYLMGWRGIRQGPPQLVRKLDRTTMPVPFALDARDLAAAGTITGNWILVARLDSDGDAAPGEGDLQGTAPGFVTADGPPVRIFLTEQLSAEDARHAKWLAQGTDTAPAAHGGMVAQDTPDAAASKTGPRFQGTITLAEDFADRNGTRTLFVMLKDKPLPRGMPRAVLKVDRPQFPLTFDIGVENVPLDVENREELLAGQMYLTARLDGDGNFMGAADDIELAAPVPVTADQKPVKLVLDTRRQN